MLQFLFKFLFILILGSLSLSALVQAEAELKPLSSAGGSVVIQGASSEASSEAPSVSAQETIVPPEGNESAVNNQDDSDLKELEEIQEQRFKKVAKIEKALDPLKDPILDPIEEIKKLGHNQLDAAALLDKKVIGILQNTFKDGIFSDLPSSEVREMIFFKSRGTLLGSLFDQFPVLLDIAVDLMRDKKAFHGLLGVMLRKEDLKTIGYLWIAFFIFGLFVKRRLVKPKWPFLRRFRWNMTINLLLNSIYFYIFYQVFSIELAPTLTIILKHF